MSSSICPGSGGRKARVLGNWRLAVSYSQKLKKLFDVDRLPSDSTIRRTLVETDYEEYLARATRNFSTLPLKKEKRKVSVGQTSLNLTDWSGLNTIIKVESQRQNQQNVEVGMLALYF